MVMNNKKDNGKTNAINYKSLLGVVKRIGFINKLLCKHDNINYGWSYIICKKCDRVRYNPSKNAELLNKFLTNMESKRHWETEKTEKIREKSRIYNH